MCETKAELVRALSSLSAQEMRDVSKAAYDIISRTALFEFSVGDEVEFITKNGEKHRGTVLKLNRQRVKVGVDSYPGGWLVPPSMLRKV